MPWYPAPRAARQTIPEPIRTWAIQATTREPAGGG